MSPSFSEIVRHKRRINRARNQCAAFWGTPDHPFKHLEIVVMSLASIMAGVMIGLYLIAAGVF